MSKMVRYMVTAIAVASMGVSVAACDVINSLTSADTASLTGAAVTLGTVAAQNNSTAATLVSKGTLICGIIDSTTGKLAETGLVALATLAGVPVAVTGMAAEVVSKACAGVGLVAGALPADVPAASVTVLPTAGAATLPPVTSVANPAS